LTLWTPHIPAPERLSAALTRARRQAAGKIDVILLDVDAPYLERAGGAAAGIDYTLIFTEHSDTGMREADQLASRLVDEAPARGSVVAVFARVSLDSIEDLPQATRERGLPVLGEAPADYLLAAGDEYSLTSAEPRLPHDTYLGAISRLARALVQIASLKASGRG
jgi:CO dehydrogenase nickel-insertion accessory protein CooC1